VAPSDATAATTFAIAYVIVRALHIVLYALAGRGDRELLGAVLRITPNVLLSGALLIAAAPLSGTAKLVCWAAVAAIDYLAPLIGHMRGWHLSPGHFVERLGQIILIALGESVVAIGVGVGGLDLDTSLIVAVLLGVTIVACVWWSYFDWVVYVGRARLEEATAARRAALARDAYSYLHLPMVGGIALRARHHGPLRLAPRHLLTQTGIVLCGRRVATRRPTVIRLRATVTPIRRNDRKPAIASIAIADTPTTREMIASVNAGWLAN
jgi:low temperature requirement protein LtrA